jgi:hypothetical protein
LTQNLETQSKLVRAKRREWLLDSKVIFFMDKKIMIKVAQPPDRYTGWSDWAQFRLLSYFFLWTVFWKIQKQPTVLGYFFPRKSNVLILTKKRLSYILGAFFTNSSGHPAGNMYLYVMYMKVIFNDFFLSTYWRAYTSFSYWFVDMRQKKSFYWSKLKFFIKKFTTSTKSLPLLWPSKFFEKFDIRRHQRGHHTYICVPTKLLVKK